MTSISDQILSQNTAILEEMLSHPFITSLTQGTLSEAAYHRYLVYEGAFVETAISIFAHATLKATDLSDKRWLIDVQKALAQDQMTYFEDSFAACSIDTAIPIPRAVSDFDCGMLEIAQKGHYADILTAMFAAEWMYWTWCSRAALGKIANTHMRRWVDLHADEAFAAQARWLKQSIDRHADSEDLSRLSHVFARVIELEIAFHTAPLDAEEARAHA